MRRLTRRQLRRIILNEVRLLNEDEDRVGTLKNFLKMSLPKPEGEEHFKSKVIDSEDDHGLFEPHSYDDQTSSPTTGVTRNTKNF